MIVDSGSTNTAGFRLTVDRSGKAEYAVTARRPHASLEVQPQPKNQRLPSSLVKRFYSDLEAASPFSAMPSGRCMKSASFGTTRTIEFEGRTTPDLSCGDRGNARLRSLIQDVNDIVEAFNASSKQKAPALQ